jgi:glycosyltransferase involved in cell wall biosynthesis
VTNNLRIGLIIPTLGQREDYLLECIKSAKKFGDVYLIVVTPPELAKKLSNLPGVDRVIPEISAGLPSALNWGFQNIPKNIEYIGWIGDDDLLASGAGTKSAEYLNQNFNTVMTYGICRYINQNGDLIGVNDFGQLAVPLLRVGPDLIPQPGSIFRREIFDRIGQIDIRFQLAFDFDLFIRLSKAGKIKFMNFEVASFRWHSDSKSVAARTRSVLEASKVRRVHLPALVRPLSIFWELPVIAATYLAGRWVSVKSRTLLER